MTRRRRRQSCCRLRRRRSARAERCVTARSGWRVKAGCEADAKQEEGLLTRDATRAHIIVSSQAGLHALLVWLGRRARQAPQRQALRRKAASVALAQPAACTAAVAAEAPTAPVSPHAASSRSSSSNSSSSKHAAQWGTPSRAQQQAARPTWPAAAVAARSPRSSAGSGGSTGSGGETWHGQRHVVATRHPRGEPAPVGTPRESSTSPRVPARRWPGVRPEDAAAGSAQASAAPRLRFPAAAPMSVRARSGQQQ
jgi:hypothetical protein